MSPEVRQSQTLGRLFGKVLANENVGLGEVIFVFVSQRGRLRLDFKGRGERNDFWVYFNHSETVEFIGLLDRSIRSSENGSKDWAGGSVKYSISDFVGGPFDEYLEYLNVYIRDGMVRLVIMGHPKNDGRDWDVLLNRNSAKQLHAYLKRAEKPLKGVEKHLTTKFKPRDLVGHLMRFDVARSETGDCPDFPLGRITGVIQGDYAVPSYIVEFPEPLVVRNPVNEFEKSFEGVKSVVLCPHHDRDMFERQLEKGYRPVPLNAEFYKFRKNVDPSEVRIARLGVEIEARGCWGTVHIQKGTRP